MDEFEEYLKENLNDYYDDFSDRGLIVVKRYIENSSKEIKLLREFAQHALNWNEPLRLEGVAQELGLWDEKRNPTKLLTGE